MNNKTKFTPIIKFSTSNDITKGKINETASSRKEILGGEKQMIKRKGFYFDNSVLRIFWSKNYLEGNINTDGIASLPAYLQTSNIQDMFYYYTFDATNCFPPP